MPKRRRAQITQRKLPTRVKAAARSPACTERRLGDKALGGGIGGAGSIWQKLTIETGWSSVKPENSKLWARDVQGKVPLEAAEQKARYKMWRYQLCMVPSSLRLTGK